MPGNAPSAMRRMGDGLRAADDERAEKTGTQGRGDSEEEEEEECGEEESESRYTHGALRGLPHAQPFLNNANADATIMVRSEEMRHSHFLVDEPLAGESDDDDSVQLQPEPSTQTRVPQPRRGLKRRIVVNMNSSKYPVIAQAARKMGWRVARNLGPDTEECNLLWVDSYITFETFSSLNKYQKANHFPGMSELAKKNLLAKNLNRLMKQMPDEYNFFPPSFILPSELEPLRKFVENQKRKPTLICKPDAGCQGKGIFLTRHIEDVSDLEGVIVQQYIPKPLLVDGFKFDLRVYVLVVSCSPLRIYLFKEGLARFCTEAYQPPTSKNLEESYMHLTNFAINKHHEDFEIEEGGDGGHKRSLTSLMSWLGQNGFKVEKVWSQIKALIVKTMLSAQPHLSHVYHTLLGEDNTGFSCFEILGFDVLLDARGRPWLIEVNHAPSFSCGSPLDQDIKFELIKNTMQLINMEAYNKRKFKQEQQAARQKRMLERRGRTHAQPSLEEREAARREGKASAQRSFETHAAKVLARGSNYELIYPELDDEALRESYAKIAAQSAASFDRDTGLYVAGRRRSAAAEKEKEKERERERNAMPKDKNAKAGVKKPATEKLLRTSNDKSTRAGSTDRTGDSAQARRSGLISAPLTALRDATATVHVPSPLSLSKSFRGGCNASDRPESPGPSSVRSASAAENGHDEGRGHSKHMGAEEGAAGCSGGAVDSPSRREAQAVRITLSPRMLFVGANSAAAGGGGSGGSSPSECDVGGSRSKEGRSCGAIVGDGATVTPRCASSRWPRCERTNSSCSLLDGGESSEQSFRSGEAVARGMYGAAGLLIDGSSVGVDESRGGAQLTRCSSRSCAAAATTSTDATLSSYGSTSPASKGPGGRAADLVNQMCACGVSWSRPSALNDGGERGRPATVNESGAGSGACVTYVNDRFPRRVYCSERPASSPGDFLLDLHPLRKSRSGGPAKMAMPEQGVLVQRTSAAAGGAAESSDAEPSRSQASAAFSGVQRSSCGSSLAPSLAQPRSGRSDGNASPSAGSPTYLNSPSRHCTRSAMLNHGRIPKCAVLASEPLPGSACLRTSKAAESAKSHGGPAHPLGTVCIVRRVPTNVPSSVSRSGAYTWNTAKGMQRGATTSQRRGYGGITLQLAGDTAAKPVSRHQ